MASNPVKDINEREVTPATEGPLEFGDDILRGWCQHYYKLIDESL